MSDKNFIIDLDGSRVPVATIDLLTQLLSEQRAMLQAISVLIAKAECREYGEVFKEYMGVASGHVRGILSDLYGKYGTTPDIL